MDITQITKTNILNKQKGTQTGVTARKAPLNKASSQASSGDGPATQESPSVFFKRRGGAANINLDFVKSPGPATSKPLHSVDKASVGQQNLQPFLADRKATSTAPAGQKPAKAHFPSPPLSVKKPAPSPVSQEGGAIMPSLGKKPLNPQKKAESREVSSLDSSVKSGKSVKSDEPEWEDLPSATHIIMREESHYSRLWLKTKALFCSSLILKVEGDAIYPLSWTGAIEIKNNEEELLSLKTPSLFTVVKRGHPYHGPIVDVPSNKNFFQKIGWKSYPKHVTALPIHSRGTLARVFVGCSVSALSEESRTDIEKMISDFFPSGDKAPLKKTG